MFSGVLIGFLAGLSAATWVYTYMARKTGGNAKSSAITAGLSGLAVFIVVVTIVATIDQMIGK